MGWGGKTINTNTTNNTSVAGGNMVLESENHGVMLSGINGDVGNISLTDYGAIQAATGIANKAMANNNAAIKEASDLGRNALKMGGESLSSALSFGRDALKANGLVSNNAMDNMNKNSMFSLKENSAVSRSAMDYVNKNSESSMSAVKAMAAQSGENARAALTMAEHTASRSQIGAAGEMSKVAIAVAIVLGVGFIAVALKGAK